MTDRNSTMRKDLKELTSPANLLQVAFIAVILIALYLISTVNFLLFHGIVELAGIAVAFSIFIIIWNTRRNVNDAFFLIAGISFLFIGSIDLVHTLAYKGMGVFPGNSADLPTQLWIAARYFQSITFLVATLFIGRSITKDRKYDAGIIIAACTAACTLLFASIFVWQNFPHCFIEGSGLTPFKIVSEYIISLILIATIVILYLKREHFDPVVWKFLIAALVFLILGELAFTSYISVFGFMNMLGHLFRLISVYLFYRAFVVVALTLPYDLLLHELKVNDDALRESEAKTRAIYEGSNDAVMLLTGKGFFDCNLRTLQMFGLKSREEFVKYHPADLSPPTQPDGRPSLDAAMEHIRAAFRNGIDRFEWVHRRKNGEDFPAEVLLSAFNYGKERVLQATVRDMTDRKQAELQIAEHSWFLTTLINTLPVPLFYKDTGGKYLGCNPLFEEYIGIPRGELMGKTVYDISPKDLADKYKAADQEIFDNPAPQKYETQVRFADGSRHDVIFYKAPFFNYNGSIAGLIGTFLDITDRKTAEEAQKRSERRLADIIDHLPDATLAIDNNGYVIAWNKAMEEMTGVKAEDILGKGDHEYSIPFYGVRRPILIDWIIASDEALEKKYTIIRREGGLIVAEVDLVLPDGRNVSLWGKATPLYDDKGNKVGAIESIRDVTDRKRTELALQQSEDKYRTLFENSGSPLMIIDEDTTILLVNREFENVSGYTREEIEGRKSWTEFIADTDDLERMKEYHRLRRISPDLTPVTYESRLIGRQGDIRNMIITVAMIPATKQSLAALVDITDRKRAEEAVQTAVKLNQLIDTMSVSECMNFTLDAAERLTASRIGFFHFINPDEQTIQLVAWSTETRKHCLIPNETERNYPVENAGVWVDCLRERKTVIHNDYASLPHKKGLPEGHVPVIRELVVPIFDEDKIVAIIGVGNKATDYDEKDINVLTLLAKNAWAVIRRKRAEEALRTSEERFRGIASNLPGIVYQFYARDTGEWGMYFVDGRSRDVYGLNPEPLDTWYDRYASCIAPEDRKRWSESIKDVVFRVAPWEFEGRFIKPTGEEMYIRGLSQPVRLQNETVWNGILLDITDRKKAEKELQKLYTELEKRVLERTADLIQAQEAFRKANEKLNLLSSITRHDILNQLLVLSGFLILLKKMTSDDAVGEYIRKAQQAATTIERHISFTKLYQDIGVKSPTWQNVRECMEKPLADLLPASVTCTVDLDVIEVYADPLFEKVLYTLIDNTLRHGEGATEIRLSSGLTNKGELILFYQDNGIGVNADEKGRIFERGYGKHTGFGLFLAREILSITGLKIQETGKAGQGARFEMVVPRGAYRFADTS